MAAPVGGGLWPVLLWWISPSQEHVAPGLFSLTRDCGVLWRFGFLPACCWSQHGRFPTSHADDQVVMWQTHTCIHTSNNTVYQFYHAEIIALFVVYLPNPCKSSSGSLLWLLNEINFQNHRHARALLKPLLRVSCCIMQYVCSNGEKKSLLTLLCTIISNRQNKTLQNVHWEIWWMALFKPPIWSSISPAWIDDPRWENCRCTTQDWLLIFLICLVIIICLSWLQTSFLWAMMYI